MIKDVIKRVKDMMEFNNRIKFNNETIKNFIMDALDKMERGIEISEVDRNKLINVILKGDRDFGIKNGNRTYTEEELQYSVYIHINEVDENYKCYIGRTSMRPKDRWGCDGNGYKTQLIYDDIKKYGWENFSHVVLCHGLSQEQANEIEVALISLFKSTNRDEFCYNVENGGDGKGKHSEETRNKISEANKGENNPMYGVRLLGGNNPNAKKVFCGGMIFSTGKLCAKFYNINSNTMCNWLIGKRKTPSEFIELGLRYATTEDINTYPLYIEEEQNQQH